MSSEPTFTRRPATGLQLAFLKATPALYRGPLAELLRWRCVMLLTTIGRKSGQPRTTAVSFMPLDGRYIVFSGWGVSSNWYRNVRANPEVTIQVGRKKMRATARLIEDPEQRRALMLRMRDRSRHCGPPRGTRWLLKATKLFDYEADIRMAVEQGDALPVIEIVPHEGQGRESS
jgi:deazaflavin-dependent oxidoreductase (nitroreductase family)